MAKNVNVNVKFPVPVQYQVHTDHTSTPCLLSAGAWALVRVEFHAARGDAFARPRSFSSALPAGVHGRQPRQGVMATTDEASTANISLSDLTIGENVGRGASCTVCVATLSSTEPHKQFALKVIEKTKIVGQAQLTRLFREKELLSELYHPSIVRLHCTLKDERNLYFVLDLLTGGELLWHMRRAPRQCVPPSAARTCVGALLLPLRHMQEKGVIYRDLKPTNIMFTLTGRLTLIDLGHAKRAGPDERSTSLCGTPHAHAPEAVRGDGHGWPAQLWALGVLIVEMMAGEAPFWETAISKSRGDDLKTQILRAQPDLSRVPDEQARALTATLLCAAPEARHVVYPRGYADVMLHPWLNALDWEAIGDGRCVPDSFDFAAAHAEHLDALESSAARAEWRAIREARARGAGAAAGKDLVPAVAAHAELS